ncbi:MAG: metallophosphoesterase [Proteobacteria bacterium]|nr:metallophosphoesterase [Pseudomonadota bacterium]
MKERAPSLRRFFAPATMLSFPRLVTYHVAHPAWTLPELKIAVVADLHVCRPWTPLSRVEGIVKAVNALGADLILLPGDFLMDRKLPGVQEPAARIIDRLKQLSAPLGVAAVLGNHDWWDCRLSRQSGFARNSVAEALEGSGIHHLPNRALEISHGGGRFWLVGLDSQAARKHLRQPGFHDPETAFDTVPPGAPAILMAHEPDYFARGDARAFLQISGHTHGGQANLLGWRPMTPSAHGSRYAWGHKREEGRHLIVSGGIGYSGLPLRLLQPPEIVVVTVTRAD